MRILSASEAIGPAWERTREVLLEPFAGRRFLKLAAVATLAALGNSFSFSSSSHGGHAGQALHPAAAVALAAALALVGLIALIVTLILFYIGSRMQFVLFEVVATRTSTIGPLWSRYGRVAWRWVGMKLLFLLGAGVVSAVIAAPFLFLVLRHGGSQGSPLRAAMHLVPFVAVVIALVLLILAVYFLLLDFALPIIALEDASMGLAMRRLGSIIDEFPGEVFLYLVLKTVLAILLFIGAMAVLGISLLILLIPFALVAGFASILLRHAGLFGHLLLVIGGGVEFLLFAALAVCLYIAAIGYVQTFLQAYALYFLGGRYPLLGNLIEPPPPAPVAAPEPLPVLPPLPSDPAANEVW